MGGIKDVNYKKMFQSIMLSGLVIVITALVLGRSQNVWAIELNSSENIKIYADDGLNVIFEITSMWADGYNANVTIKNDSDADIEDWYLDIITEDRISNIWNATVYDEGNDEYVIKNIGWNQDIVKGSFVSFGYSVAKCFEDFPDDIVLMKMGEINVSDDIDFSYSVTGSWENGFNGNIRIKNIGSIDIEDWKLILNFDNVISNIWNAQIISSEYGRYIISGCSYNQNIKAGEIIEIGFTVNAGNSENKVCEFELSGLSLIPAEDSNVETYSFSISGVSGYGVNVISVDSEEYEGIEIIRIVDGVEESVGKLSDTNYFIDMSVDAGREYAYYALKSYEDSITVLSNEIVIAASNAETDENGTEFAWATAIDYLDEDYDWLEIGYNGCDSQDYVSEDIYLTREGIRGSSIEWTSSHSDIVSTYGVVTRPYAESNTEVVLKATLRMACYSISKEFVLKVVPASVAEVCNMDIDDLKSLNGGNLPKMEYDAQNELNFIKGNVSEFPIRSADDAYTLVCNLAALFGIANPSVNLKLDRISINIYDDIYYFSQYYNGIKVIGASVTVIADHTNGEAYHIYSSYLKDPDISLVPAITMEEAIRIANDDYETKVCDMGELIVYAPDAEIIDPVLAWKLSAADSSGIFAYVDAYTGSVLYKEDDRNVGWRKTSYTEIGNDGIKYGDGVVDISTNGGWKKTTYKLYDSVRKIKVYDVSPLDPTKPDLGKEEYTRDDNDWSDPQYDIPLAALYNTQAAYDFFEKLGWKGYDGAGAELALWVHYQKWNDKSGWSNVLNAYSSGSDKALKFGDGDGAVIGPYGNAVDVVAHEYTHRVTANKIGIEYSRESGAIDEAYADIFGEFADPAYDWLHGTGVYIDKSGRCNRDLMTPDKSSIASHLPSMYLQKGYYKSTKDESDDHGNVHNNSTVISHAAYLMSLTIPKEDLIKIWYRSYNYYNDNKRPKFIDCRRAVEEAADMLYGPESQYALDVRKAFDAVNVAEYEVTIVIRDAVTGEVIPDQPVVFTTSDMEYCDLTNLVNLQCCDPDFSINTCCSGRSQVMRRTDEEGIITYDRLIKGKHRINVAVNGCDPIYWVIQVDKDKTYFEILIETEYKHSIKGKVSIADEDTNPANNLPLDKCSVSIKKLTGNVELDYSASHGISDSDGNYQFSNLPAGFYEITFSKSGYINVTQTIQIKKNQTYATYNNIALEIIPDSYAYGTGFATGNILDASTGNGISGLTLEIYGGVHLGVEIPDEKCVDTIKSGDLGSYRTDALPAGTYTVVVSDRRTGVKEEERYLQGSFVIKILGKVDIRSQNGTVSKTLEALQTRIVLTWGASPDDLDAHLKVTIKDKIDGEIYYGKPTMYVDDIKLAELDVDDVSYYGPETITIFTIIEGEYVYYVHDYADQYYGVNNYYLSRSGATVTVYTDNSNLPVRTYHVPDGLGTVWTVFRYDPVTQTFTDINTISA